jgi:hypothetical protein
MRDADHDDVAAVAAADGQAPMEWNETQIGAAVVEGVVAVAESDGRCRGRSFLRERASFLGVEGRPRPRLRSWWT